ncbi:MAG: hypothetical protein RLN72_13420, partial [Henriciella sp.]
MRRSFAILLVLAVFGSIFGLASIFQTDRMELWQPLEGPEQASQLGAYRTAQLSDYGEGGEDRLAVLVTEADSNWLGLAHGLKTIGVPFIMTDDAERALRHDVVLVYPLISGRNIEPEILRALARFPQSGGTLIA